MSTSVTFDILARDKASATFRKIGGNADRLHRSLVGIGKIGAAGIAAGAIAGIAGITAVVKTGIGEVSDYEAGLARLRAGLKSTGGISGVTAKQMEALASQIQDYSGQTDDSIVATEQLLLTFTNIRNSAGKNNDIFTQTTKIAADMAARMGGDASGAAIQLGKALNDPVKGITALTRVGVSFTAGQKKQIQALLEAHKGLKAQKIILGELRKEFGGSAKAVGESFAGQLAKLKRGFEDVSQTVVTAMIPTLTKVGHFLRDTALPALQAFGQSVTSRLRPALTTLADVFESKILPYLRTFGQFIQTAVMPALRTFGGFLADTVIPAVIKVAGAIYDALGGAFRRITGAIKGNSDGLHNLWAAFKTVAGVVLKVVVPVVGFVLKKALSLLGNVISWVIDIFGAVGRAGGAVADFFKGPFVRAVGSMVSFFVKGAKFIADVWFKVMGAVAHVGAKAFGWLPFGVGDAVKSAADSLDKFKFYTDALLSGIATDAAGWGEATGSNFANGFEHGFASNFDIGGASFGGKDNGWDRAGKKAKDVSNSVVPPFEANAPKFRGAGEDAGDEVAKGLSNAASRVIDAAKSMVEKIDQQFQDLKRKAKDLAKSIADTMRSSADLSNISGTDSLGAAMAPSVQGIKDFLHDQLKKDREFRRTLKQLHHRGLSDSLYRQLALAGPDAAGGIVQALAGASREDLRDISRTNRRIGNVAGGFGQSVAQDKYGAALREAHKDQKEARRLLRDLVREVKKDDDLSAATLRGMGRQFRHSIKDLKVVTDTDKQDHKQGVRVVAG